MSEAVPHTYIITITRVENYTVLESREHKVIDERPWTEKEVNDEVRNLYKSKEDFLKQSPLKRVYGHTPEVRVTKTKEVEVLKQTVVSLDLPAVIRAINNL